jgi:hypothetical protein
MSNPAHSPTSVHIPPYRSSARAAFIAACCVALAAVASGCGKSGETSSDAEIRVLNLAPESGTISVRLDEDDTQWQSNIGYKSTTAFKNYEAGSQRTRISTASSVVLDQTLAYSASKKQLLVVYGGASSLGMQIIYNDISSASSGKSKLRLINLAVGLGAYDLYMTTSSEDYRSVEPKVRNAASTTYEIDAGSYAVRLTSSGTKDTLFEMPARSFDDRKYYNLVLYNEGSGELPQAFYLTQDDDAGPSFLTSTVTRIRAGNAQATFPNLNVNIGSSRVFTNIPFAGLSSFTRTTSGTRTVAFQESINGTIVSSINEAFEGGRDYSVFLAPAVAGGEPTAFRLLDRTFPPSSGKARVRLVNASSVSDLSLALSFSPITPNVSVRAASDYFEVNAGDGTPVTITQGTAGTPVVSLSGTDLSTGRTYTVVVSGSAGALALTVRQDN